MGTLAAIIVAAGRGSRMGTAESKQFLLLQGKPILVHTAARFQAIPEIEAIVLVTGSDDIARCEEYVARYALSKVISVVAGGADRQESVYRGLDALPGETEWVLVHDGVRPFVTREQIIRCWREAMHIGAAVVAVPVKDTIKVVSPQGRIQSTPDRSSLWAIQTPQAFRLSLLRQAHEAARKTDEAATDDAMLVERLGAPVQVVAGDESNFKITVPEDLERAEWLMARSGGEKQAMIRVGQGFDVHQLASGRRCVIGGVDIPCDRGLLGHSDADVLLHAISDAILGALGLGDIGKHFPDTDPQYKDADSLMLLKHVWALAREREYRLGNLDTTIIAQKPRMAPYIPDMIRNIAGALDADAAQINVKATTTETLGFVGREEGIAAQAVVCLLRDTH